MKSFVGNEEELFDFMRENDYGVYDRSNIFLRDIEYAIRDYFRVHEDRDIGLRASGRLAQEVVNDLVKREILRPQSSNTWVLFDERYRLPSQKELEEKEEEQERVAETVVQEEPKTAG